jgi:hypothetical protein
MHARWQSITSDQAMFEAFRHSLLKSSLLMPPLYVGKTHDLRTRCGQHLAGSAGNDFHKRFETFAAERSLPAREVTDLILVTISTALESVDPPPPMEDVLEAALKAIAAPPYSAL